MFKYFHFQTCHHVTRGQVTSSDITNITAATTPASIT